MQPAPGSHIVVVVSAETAEEAAHIAKTTVERKLVACAQIFPIRSWYEWEGDIVNSDEQLVLLKSHSDVYEHLEACIQEEHSYDVPEIIALPITAGFAPYLNWIDTIVKGRQ